MHAARETLTDRLPALFGFLAFLMLSRMPEGLIARHVSPDFQNRTAVLLAVLFGVAGILVATALKPERFLAALRAAWPLLLLLALCALSTAWSLKPSSTARSAVHVGGLLMTAVALAALVDWRGLFTGLSGALLVIAAISVLTIPFGGLMQDLHAGQLRGPFIEKNEAGQVYALGMIACATMAVLQLRLALAWLAGAFASLALLLLSGSGTALIAGMAGLVTLAGIEIARRSPVRLIVLVWTGVALALLAGLALAVTRPDLAAAIGKDGTLTGRTEIWSATLQHMEGVLWRGHGYEAFWTDASVPRAWVWAQVGFEVHHAHNAWLETLVGVGLPGCLLLAWALLRGAGMGIAGLLDGRPGRLALPMIVFIAIAGLTECVFSGPDGLAWFVFLTLSTKLAMAPAPRARARIRPLSLQNA